MEVKTEEKKVKVTKSFGVRIIKLINGDDIICVVPADNRQTPDASPVLRIIKPLLLKYVPSIEEDGLRDYIALVKWTSYSNDELINVPKDKIMTITSANEAIQQSYKNVSKGYSGGETDSLNQEVYTKEKMTDEMSSRINEIFDSLTDEDTKH